MTPCWNHTGKETTSALANLIRVILNEKEKESPSLSLSPTQTSSQLALKNEKTQQEQPCLLRLDEPVVVLAFDEAHTLIDSKNADNSSLLRRTLRSLNEYSLFSLFLSTMGKLNQFSSAPGKDSLTHIQIGGLDFTMPFMDLGFDQLAAKVSLDGSLTLEDVDIIDHMVTLGYLMYVSAFIHFKQLS